MPSDYTFTKEDLDIIRNAVEKYRLRKQGEPYVQQYLQDQAEQKQKEAIRDAKATKRILNTIPPSLRFLIDSQRRIGTNPYNTPPKIPMQSVANTSAIDRPFSFPSNPRFTGQPSMPPASTAFAIPESIKKLITTKKGVRYLKKILKPVTDPEPRQIIKLGHDNPMKIIRRGPSGLETFLKAFIETLDRYALTEKEAEEMKRKQVSPAISKYGVPVPIRS